MSWNYRVLKTLDADGKTELWGIHEVFYDADGAVRNWTVNPSYPLGESWREFHRDSAHYAKALTKPPIDVSSGEAKELTITGRVKKRK